MPLDGDRSYSVAMPPATRAHNAGTGEAEHSSHSGASEASPRIAMRPSTVGPSWHELFHPGTATAPPMAARVLVVADIVGALRHIHENTGCPKQHRRHGRVTPRHVLIGLDGSASLTHCRKPFCHPLPTQPDLGYLAPEVLSGAGPADSLSDVFSAGVLLWEALDNGRIFPHRHSAAIVRLMGRTSLPVPRGVEEWAHPLRDVALRALNPDPGRRHQSATELWQDLRNCLPSLEQPREVLSKRVLELLKFRLTDQIRDEPPYWQAPSTAERSAPESPSAPPASAVVRSHARYSLAPVQSGTNFPPRSAATTPPPPVAPPSSPPTMNSAPASQGGPVSQVVARRPKIAQPPSSAPQSTNREPANPTYQVNLPEGLVNASMPYLLTGPPSIQPATPWGLVAVAGVAFFAVGAAVALGAVNALRPPPAAVPPISFSVPPGAELVPNRNGAAVQETAKKASQPSKQTPNVKRSKRKARSARPKSTVKAQRVRRSKQQPKPEASGGSGDLPFAKTPF